MASYQTPHEPTAEQCSAKERVQIPGSDVRAHAVWWPQMGGYAAKAVVTVGDCKEAWVWHDGQFPFSGNPDYLQAGETVRGPVQLHLDDSQQWIDFFELQQAWYDEEFNGGPEPYVWTLPAGVTRAQAQEVYEKIVAWGLWEPDPGGFVIRTHAESIKPCTPPACPPLGTAALSLTETALAPLPAEWFDLVKAPARLTPAAPQIPTVVSLPADVDSDQAGEAIRICRELGLLADNPAGTLLLPHGLLLPPEQP